VPSYIKPYTRILSWTIPLVFEEEANREAISDYMDISPVIRGVMKYFKSYYRASLGRVLIQNLIQGYKISPDPRSLVLRTIDDFLDRCCKEQLTSIDDVKASMLNETGIKFIEQVFEKLNKDVVPLIARPMQWLVMISNGNEKKLTRLCWVVEINGKVEIRKYGFSNILLVISEATLEKINSADLKSIKRNATKKEEINDKWAQLVAESQLERVVEAPEVAAEVAEEQQELEEKKIVGSVE